MSERKRRMKMWYWERATKVLKPIILRNYVYRIKDSLLCVQLYLQLGEEKGKSYGIIGDFIVNFIPLHLREENRQKKTKQL